MDNSFSIYLKVMTWTVRRSLNAQLTLNRPVLLTCISKSKKTSKVPKSAQKTTQNGSSVLIPVNRTSLQSFSSPSRLVKWIFSTPDDATPTNSNSDHVTHSSNISKVYKLCIHRSLLDLPPLCYVLIGFHQTHQLLIYNWLFMSEVLFCCWIPSSMDFHVVQQQLFLIADTWRTQKRCPEQLLREILYT